MKPTSRSLMKFYLIRRGLLSSIPFSVFAIVVMCFSCNEAPSSTSKTNSELIIKINAVQEQIMAQGNITENEEQALLSLCSIVSHNDGLANYDSSSRMVLKDVELVPIYNGCEELSIVETRRCFNNKISSFVEQEFNLSLSKDLKLSEPKHVDTFFIINENGKVTGMKVREAEVTIQAEVLRILRKMPEMKPAIHKGKPVSVLCSITIKYGNEVEVNVVYIPEIPIDLELNN